MSKDEIVNKTAFAEVVMRLKVIARSTSEDKYMLITGLKEMNHVVAVTGDNDGDPPSLK
jgi:magnesium-transporting ATPase (P-type)